MHLDKAKIKHSFATASITYDDAAALQRNVGKALLDTIDHKTLNGVLLDLGCGTGFISAELLETESQQHTVIAMDIALPMVQVTRRKLAAWDNIMYLCADAEQLPLAEQVIDGVFSNLTLQWCVNLDAVFTDIKRVLKPTGHLIFSTFGPQTLQELKAAWAECDTYNHVNNFYSQEQLIYFLQRAGFFEIVVETKLYISRYNSVLALMKELKHQGAHYVIAGRNKNITGKTLLQSMIAAYERHRIDNLIPATFEVIMVSAIKHRNFS